MTSSVINVARNLFKNPEAEEKEGEEQHSTCQIHSFSSVYQKVKFTL